VRWILLVMYLLIVAGFFGLAYSGRLPDTDPLGDVFYGLHGQLFWTLLILALTFASQALFIFTLGTADLCKPVRRRRLIGPAAMAAALVTVLVSGIILAAAELFDFYPRYGEIQFWSVLGINWLFWSALFLLAYRHTPRLKIIAQWAGVLISGSLLELLITIPAHIVASRRPGCFAGMYTGLGVVAGILVMFWAFGPGIIFLFLSGRSGNGRADTMDKERRR